ncbi:MAG: hypothetical protein ACLFQP_09765 [Halothece sp.]
MRFSIKLLGWSVSGLRCPDHEVNLCVNQTGIPYPVTLIQMPNGTGKTTTLNLLRATLSGIATEWNHDPKKIREFRRTSESSPSGQFIVKLSVSDKPVTFELNFDFVKEVVAYRTTHGSGIKDRFEPPPELRRFLNPNFVSLFVFDGELANNLLDSKQTKARNAIDSLFQLSLLEDLEKRFKENWESHAKTAKVVEKKGLTRRRTRLFNLKGNLETYQNLLRVWKSQKVELETKLESAQKEYNLALIKDKDTGTELKETLSQLKEAEIQVQQDVIKVIAAMRDPHKLHPKFGLALQNLKKNFDTLKLPTSTSKEFFEELADAEECVCGRPMNETTRQTIRDRASRYLGEDEVGILNSIKSDITTNCSEAPLTYSKSLQEQLDTLGQYVFRHGQIQTKLDGIEEARLAQGDTDLEAKKQSLEQLQKQYEVCQSFLEELERSPRSKPSDDTMCIKELQQLIKDAEQDVAEATNTLILKEKTDIVSSILSKAHSKAREELRQLILDETNDRIQKLLSREPILLADIQDSLKIEGKEKGSVGQTLSVGYAFLATLFNRSDYELPFIVDSPAGPLDLNVRTEVADLIPSLCQQFVAFTISSERQNFTPILHQAAQEKVQYLTIFRNTGSVEIQPNKISADDVIETFDGLIVKGRDFFEKFDLDEERGE